MQSRHYVALSLHELEPWPDYTNVHVKWEGLQHEQLKIPKIITIEMKLTKYLTTLEKITNFWGEWHKASDSFIAESSVYYTKTELPYLKKTVITVISAVNRNFSFVCTVSDLKVQWLSFVSILKTRDF